MRKVIFLSYLSICFVQCGNPQRGCVGKVNSIEIHLIEDTEFLPADNFRKYAIFHFYLDSLRKEDIKKCYEVCLINKVSKINVICQSVESYTQFENESFSLILSAPIKATLSPKEYFQENMKFFNKINWKIEFKSTTGNIFCFNKSTGYPRLFVNNELVLFENI